jgi:hypothetical protein
MTVDVTHFLFAIRSAPIRLPMLCSSVVAARRSDIERRRPSLRQRIDQSVAAEPVAGGFSRNGVGKTEAKVELLHFVTTAAAANPDPAFAVSPLNSPGGSASSTKSGKSRSSLPSRPRSCVASFSASPQSRASLHVIRVLKTALRGVFLQSMRWGSPSVSASLPTPPTVGPASRLLHPSERQALRTMSWIVPFDIDGLQRRHCLIEHSIWMTFSNDP